MKIIRALFFYVFCTSIISCAGLPPKDEYVLTFTAIENAKKAQSEKFEPKLTYQFKKMYEKALNFYEERNYSKAKEYFLRSRFLAEKAELKSRIKKFKNGEVVL